MALRPVGGGRELSDSLLPALLAPASSPNARPRETAWQFSSVPTARLSPIPAEILDFSSASWNTF